MKVCIISAKIPPSRCGLADHTARLANTINSTQISILTSSSESDSIDVDDKAITVQNSINSWGVSSAFRIANEITSQNPDLILIQWVPYLYSRLGTKLGLPLAACLLRLRGKRVHTYFHELWVGTWPPKHALLSVPQRIAAFLLILASKKISVSTKTWTKLLKKHAFWRRADINWLPVGSNISKTETPTTQNRNFYTQFDIPEDAIKIATFSPEGAGKSRNLIRSAWESIHKEDNNTHLIVIGNDSKSNPLITPSKNVHQTGYIKNENVSEILKETDLLLAPFTDGLSTRRGSVMAGIHHGVAVLSTNGPLFDREIFEHSPLFISENDAASYAQKAVKLCSDKDLLKDRGIASAKFYNDNFTWEDNAKRLMEQT